MCQLVLVLLHSTQLLVVLSWHAKADPTPIPDQTQQDSRKHQFSGLNWLRNVIKWALNYIPEPIKHIKTSVFCYAVQFRSGIKLGSAFACHDKTTSKLSLTSFKVWFFYVLPPLGQNGSLHDDVIHVALIAQSRIANYQLPTSSGQSRSNSSFVGFLIWTF